MVVGAALTISMLIIATYATTQYGAAFPEPVMSEEQLASTTDAGEIVYPMSGFLWDYRGLDLLMQSVVLFAAATGCTAMLRVIREEK